MRSDGIVRSNIAKSNTMMRVLKFVLIFIAISIFLVVTSVLVFNYFAPKLESPTSILILGKGGEGHTAPNLTDTIMVAYLNPNQKKTSVLSLPRDIWVAEIRAKLNTAYHYGGFKMAGDSVYGITNIKPNNTIVIDFTLFKDLIDAVGGLDVVVSNSFTDNKYPIAGLEKDLCNGDKTYKCRYEIVSFKEGKQTMNGELALKFVRSRNAEGNEGTDLARELRQQKVIFALKEKVLSVNVLLSPKIINNLYNVFTTHIETDFDKRTVMAIGRFVIESELKINFLSIPEGMILVSQNNAKYDKQYVFVPKEGNWNNFKDWLKSQI